MAKMKPRGNNEMGPKFSFYQREFYEESVDEVLQENPQLSLIDLQEKTLYGKVNLDNEVVAPQLNKMVSFGGTFQTFDFIAEALTDLIDSIEVRLNNGTMRRSGPYADIKPSNNNLSWKEEYVSYLSQLQESYSTQFMDTPAKKDQIKNFRQYVTSFLDFAAAANPGYPMTFSKYFISRHSNVFTTGIAFEISQESYGEDYTSFTKYFDDINFRVFAQEAQNHGFIIDRHAPYRLIANLTSRPMKKYMQRNDHANVADVFDKLYFSPMKAEFYEIVKMISFLYSETYPPGSTYAEICYKNGKTSYSLKPRETFRAQDFTSLEDLISYMGISTWLRIYSFIKAREVNINLSQREFDDIVEKAINLNKVLDIESALVYINDRFNPLFISEFNQKPTFKF
jgi:hypothetical protein